MLDLCSGGQTLSAIQPGFVSYQAEKHFQHQVEKKTPLDYGSAHRCSGVKSEELLPRVIERKSPTLHFLLIFNQTLNCLLLSSIIFVYNNVTAISAEYVAEF